MENRRTTPRMAYVSYEPFIGCSRAVRVGNLLMISATPEKKYLTLRLRAFAFEYLRFRVK